MPIMVVTCNSYGILTWRQIYSPIHIAICVAAGSIRVIKIFSRRPGYTASASRVIILVKRIGCRQSPLRIEFVIISMCPMTGAVGIAIHAGNQVSAFVNNARTSAAGGIVTRQPITRLRCQREARQSRIVRRRHALIASRSSIPVQCHGVLNRFEFRIHSTISIKAGNRVCTICPVIQ